MYFYHHYIQKGFTLEYLYNLNFYSKQFMTASLDIELSKENKRKEIQDKLLKDGGAMAVFPVQL